MRRQIDPNLNGFDGEKTFSAPKNNNALEFDILGDDVSENHDLLAEKTEHRHHHHHHHSSGSGHHHHHHHHHSNSGESEHHHHSNSGESEHHHHSHSGESEHHHHSNSGESEHHHHSNSGESEHHHHHNHHSSSHSRSKKKKSKLPLAIRIAIVILVVLLIFVFTAGGTLLYMGNKGKNALIIEKPETPYEEMIEYNGSTYVYDKNKVAFAFIGVDKQEIRERNDDYGTSGQADTDMIAVVDTSTGNISIITLPRDTMVDIDLYSKSGTFLRTEQKQLCLAYAYGDGMEKSCANVTSAMSRILMNIPIEKYFALDLKGIAPLNDAIGGVTLESLDDFPEKNIKKGDTITIKGNFAEAYVRSRDMDYIEASLNRTKRQNQYIKAYADKVKTAAIKDFSVITSLYNTANKYSQTNITLNDVTYIASLILSKGVGSFTSYTIDGEMKASAQTVNGNGVYAEYYADENSVLDIVINCFYTKVS